MSADRAIEIVTRSEEQTIAVARALARRLCAGDAVALSGELGAGKTTFVRGLAEGLGLDPRQVSSPTFVLLHEYRKAMTGVEMPPLPLLHVDAYRVSPDEDPTLLGLDAAGTSQGILAIEWPERFGDAPTPTGLRWTVFLGHEGLNVRRLLISAPPSVEQRELELLSRELAAPRADAQSRHLRCRTCGKALPPDVETAPFCSARCRMADLGRWFSESYRISKDIRPTDSEQDA